MSSVTICKPFGNTVRRTAPSSWGRRRPALPRGTTGIGANSTSEQPLRRHRLLNHRNQRQLAAIINLIDLDLNLLSDAEHILNILNPLATCEWTQLGDVQQTVLARQQCDKRAEGGDLDDCA